MKLIFTTFIICFASTLFAQMSKHEVLENINEWYNIDSVKYSLNLKGQEVAARVTKYHINQVDEKEDLIEVVYGSMNIILKFDKALSEVSMNQDSLQKYFSYISLSNIYHEIPSKGWVISPKTPQSTMRGKGVKFISNEGYLSLEINWSIYAVTGFKDNVKCNREAAMADSGMPEECYVVFKKKKGLEILISNIPLELN
jgi:hypothetical protein